MINFKSVFPTKHSKLVEHYNQLLSITITSEIPFDDVGVFLTGRLPPDGFENYCCVDALGDSLKWLNENFSKEKYEWYLWFESVFLIPPEMQAFLILKN